MTVSKRARYEVLRRDNHTCRYCGGTAPDVALTIDHVTPVALGGTDDPGNLVVACRDCNAGKASTPPGAVLVADVSQADLRWSAAVKRAAAIRSTQRAEFRAYLHAFDGIWCGSCPPNAPDTIQALFLAGLPVEELSDAVHIALSARGIQTTRFRYFCGVAWRKVSDLQDIARSLLAADEADG